MRHASLRPGAPNPRVPAFGSSCSFSNCRDTLVANRRALQKPRAAIDVAIMRLGNSASGRFRPSPCDLCVLFDAHLAPKATGQGLARNIVLDPTIARGDLQRDFSKCQGKISGRSPRNEAMGGAENVKARTEMAAAFEHRTTTASGACCTSPHRASPIAAQHLRCMLVGVRRHGRQILETLFHQIAFNRRSEQQHSAWR